MMHAPVAPAPPAGFWIRVVAAVIDLLVFAIVEASLSSVAGLRWGAEADGEWAFQSAIVIFTLLFTAAYTTILHAVFGQTVGKMLVGIEVVAVDGTRLPFGAALLRYLAYYVSLFAGTVGFLMAGLRRDKRALHDLLAGSRVEWLPRRRRLPRPPAPLVSGTPSAV